MKKAPLYIYILGLALAFFVLSAPAAYAQVQFCENDQACNNGQFCDGVEVCVWSESQDASICAPGSAPCQATETCIEDNDECVLETGCESDEDCDDSLFCNGEEECIDAECVSGMDPCEMGEMCDEDSDACIVPECETDEDCAAGEICRQNVCVDAAGCVLKIKPKKVRLSTMFRPVERRFRITGSEGFDPYAAIDFGLIDVKAAAVNKKGVLKVRTQITAGAKLSKEPVRVSVGECVGEILFK